MLGQKKEYTLIKSYCKFDLTGKYVYQRSTIVDIWQTILQRIKTKKLTCKDIEILDEDIQKKEDFNKFHAWVVDWFNNTPEEIERFLEDIQLDRRNNGEYAYTLTTKFDGERMYEIYKEKQKELVKEAIKHGNPDLIKGEQKDGQNSNTGPSL